MACLSSTICGLKPRGPRSDHHNFFRIICGLNISLTFKTCACIGKADNRTAAEEFICAPLRTCYAGPYLVNISLSYFLRPEWICDEHTAKVYHVSHAVFDYLHCGKWIGNPVRGDYRNRYSFFYCFRKVRETSARQLHGKLRNLRFMPASGYADCVYPRLFIDFSNKRNFAACVAPRYKVVPRHPYCDGEVGA